MIAFASRTGNVSYIVQRLALPAMQIEETSVLSEPFLLITYTDGLGEVPSIVEQFMEKNGQNCQGVVASGNRNFGHTNFGGAGDKLARQWQVPLIRKLELRGFPDDYDAIRQYYEQCIGREHAR